MHLRYSETAGNGQRTLSVVCIFVLILLSYPFFSFPQSIYNKEVKESQVIDINGKEIKFPSKKMVNVIILFNPENASHLRQLTEIKFILDEFSRKDVDSWAVCKNAGMDSLKELEHLNYYLIIDSKKTIIGYVSDYYCDSCLSIMFIKEKKIKYWSTSISYDFIREWLKENIENEK